LALIGGMGGNHFIQEQLQAGPAVGLGDKLGAPSRQNLF
jgi:hypothetical protein